MFTCNYKLLNDVRIIINQINQNPQYLWMLNYMIVHVDTSIFSFKTGFYMTKFSKEKRTGSY